ncbi:hypothetical protein IPF86_02890 [Candidatus Nomurabacteria bacterium]|nr:MAG: hypothetical protein IPF86_02890 [Candidatus Nomurabacteria bacterium]
MRSGNFVMGKQVGEWITYDKKGKCYKINLFDKKKTDFKMLSAPAQRALANAHITTIAELAKWSEEKLLTLHGMGPSSLPKLRTALKASGKSFKVNK